MRFLATLLIGGLAGLGATSAAAYEPESGLWWNPSESGTGYTLEIQDNLMALTVYGGAQNGAAKWYSAVGFLTYSNDSVRFEATLESYYGVQPMGQPPVPPAAQPHQPQQVIDGPGRRAQGRRGQVCAQLLGDDGPHLSRTGG